MFTKSSMSPNVEVGERFDDFARAFWGADSPKVHGSVGSDDFQLEIIKGKGRLVQTETTKCPSERIGRNA